MFITTFCKQNSIRFYPADNTRPPQYTFVHFDDASFAATVQPWQMKTVYHQKAMFGDQFAVMVHTQNSGTVPEPYPSKLYMLDHNKVLLHDMNFAPHYIGTQTPTNDFYTDSVSDVAYQMNCSLWVFTFGAWLIPATDSGIYYLRLDNTDPTGLHIESFYSEPIFLSDTQDRTLYFEYSNNSNKNDVIVNGWASGYFPVFRSRIEADIREYKPFGISIGYTEQDYLQLQQYGQSWRTWMLRLGSNTSGVPAYMLERAAEILNCDNLLIDGKAFIFDDQSANGSANAAAFWKVTDTAISPLVHADIAIREKYSNENTRFNISVAIFTVPGITDATTGLCEATVPFAIIGFQLFNGISYANCPQFVFRGIVDITNFLNYLNTTLKVTAGMAGSFAYDTATGTYYYNNASGESWGVVVVYDVLTSYLQLPIDVISVGDTWFIAINTATGGAELVIDWGDNDTFPYDTEADIYPSSGTYLPVKVYPAGGTLYPYIFLNNNVTDLFLVDSLVRITLTTTNNIMGHLPSGLEGLTIAHQNMAIANVNIPIASCADNLQSISIEDCNIMGFANDLFGTNNFAVLSYIGLGVNNIPASEIDALFNAFENNTTFPSSGTFDTSGQSPIAAPTTASLIARTTLNYAGWTIITD